MLPIHAINIPLFINMDYQSGTLDFHPSMYLHKPQMVLVFILQNGIINSKTVFEDALGTSLGIPNFL